MISNPATIAIAKAKASRPAVPKGPSPQGNPGLAAAAGNASSGGGQSGTIKAPAAPNQYGNGTPGSGATAPTAKPATPITTPSPVNPYLNAAQIAAYTSAVNKDQSTIGGAAAQSGTLANTFDQDSAKNGASAATSFDKTNQSDASRGFGFSGIHDNAMADIQANAVMNQNNYNTAYKTGLATLASNVTNAQNDIGQLGIEYSGIASENAQTTATQNGTTVSPSTYALPTVTAPVSSTPAVTAPPVTYFANPNMGAINSAISQGAAAGTAAGVPA